MILVVLLILFSIYLIISINIITDPCGYYFNFRLLYFTLSNHTYLSINQCS